MVNISELLKDAPDGMKLYSPLFGEVKFLSVDSADSTIVVETERETHEWFSSCGRYKVAKSHLLYSNAECLLFPSKYCRTWEGWKAPVEPVFKVGDWVVRKDGETFCSRNYAEQITLIEVDEKGKCVWLSSNSWVCDDVIRPWTIADARDGDVLASDDGFIMIVKDSKGSRWGWRLSRHCALLANGSFNTKEIHTNPDKLHPGTKEQRDLFFAKMKEAGYEWDADEKELHEIQHHYDYQELELPTKPPKFKVGDWIVQNDNGTVSQITKTINGKDERGEYRAYEHTNGYFAACFEGEYHLWTIQDAKDGDVLAAHECYVIFKEIDGLNIKCHCTYHYMGFNPSFYIDTLQNKTAFKPANKEQRDLLFAKMKEAGYQWDACKKEIKRSIKPKFKLHDIIMRGSNLYGMRTIMHVNNEKMTYGCSDGKDIPFSEQDLWHLVNSHYLINYFKPFQKVLVRQEDDYPWRCDFYSHKEGAWFFTPTSCYRQCIPFEGNENLVGTEKPCPQEYVNW